MSSENTPSGAAGAQSEHQSPIEFDPSRIPLDPSHVHPASVFIPPRAVTDHQDEIATEPSIDEVRRECVEFVNSAFNILIVGANAGRTDAWDRKDRHAKEVASQWLIDIQRGKEKALEYLVSPEFEAIVEGSWANARANRQLDDSVKADGEKDVAIFPSPAWLQDTIREVINKQALRREIAAKRKGGRPRKWDALYSVIVRMDAEHPDWSDARKGKRYHKDFGKPINSKKLPSAGKTDKEIAKRVQRVRSDYKE